MNQKRITIFIGLLFVLTLSVVLAFGLAGYRYSSEYIFVRHIPFEQAGRIDCRFWKYSGGAQLGTDAITFKDGRCSIEGDTLFIHNEPCAQVIQLAWRFTDYQLTLETLDEGELSYYVSK